MHIIAAKAIAFKEALGQDFINYSHQVVKNAKTLAEQMIKKGYKLVSDGTDTHLILIDLSAKLISGKIAEQVLEKAGITVNKNMVPFDQKSPMVTSGIRIGTPAITTRGMKENEILIISELIDSAITNYDDDKVINEIKIKVKELCAKFPLYEWGYKWNVLIVVF